MLTLAPVAEWSVRFWPAVFNHLWQSTLFAAVVFLLALLLRRAPARVRYALWFLALMKFAVPAGLLGPGIASLSPASTALVLPAAYDMRAPAIVAIAAPLEGEISSPPRRRDAAVAVSILLTIVWLAGIAVLLIRWFRQVAAFERDFGDARAAGARERALLREACARLGLRQDVGLLFSDRMSSPGIWGVVRPLILMPEKMASSLTEEELSSVLMHELVHAERRDNLSSSLQMAVCILFWFHPLVWIIDRLLLAERELACDERVVRAVGDARTYASGLLKVVRFCLGWRVAGVSYAAHSSLRRRIERMSSQTLDDAIRTREGLLLSAALVLFVAGSLGAAWLGQVRAAAPGAREEVHRLGRFVAEYAARNSFELDDPGRLAELIGDVRGALPEVVGMTIEREGMPPLQSGERCQDARPDLSGPTSFHSVTGSGREVLVFRSVCDFHGRVLCRTQVLLDKRRAGGRDPFERRGRFMAEFLARRSEAQMRYYGPGRDPSYQELGHLSAASGEVVPALILDDTAAVLVSRGWPAEALPADAVPLTEVDGRAMTVFKAPIHVVRDGGSKIGEVRVALANTGGR